jgi:hypothetical protein
VTEYPSNSKFNRGKTPEPVEEKVVEKVIVGEVIRQKKPIGRKFKEIFVGGEAKSVWQYIAMDVLVPAAKDMVSDAVSQGIDRMLFGERGPRYTSPRRRGYASTQVSYNRYAPTSRGRDPRMREEPQFSRRARASHDFDEILIPTRPEAEQVIERMYDLMQRYSQVTVSDLYDLVGLTGNFTDEAWGWYDLRGTDIVKVRNGYLLDLPSPIQLDR